MAIRVGIIGRNFVVDWMLAAMEQVPELRPAAIYSRNEETGREFAEKTPSGRGVHRSGGVCGLGRV